jgi:putative hydrolase of the HAD superfamily
VFKYKNVVFDMGNVLVNYDPDLVTKQYTDDPALIREVHNVLFCSQEWLKLDAGLISEESALRSVLKRFRTEEGRSLAAKCFWDWDKYNMHPAPGMAEIIQELKARGNGVYVLSNASIRLPKVYRRVMPAAELYDGVFFSAEYRCIKPQAIIYETFLERFRLKAKDCFFIDDLPENIEGAEAAGMGGFCYTPGRTGELRKILELP